MKTIKIKLFLIFLSCMAAFVLSNILLNTVFLEKFYIYKNREVFQVAYQEIRATYKNPQVRIEDLLKQWDRVDGISGAISDRDMNLKYTSYPQNISAKAAKLPGEFEKLVRENERRSPRSYIYSIVETPDYQVREIAFAARLDNGDLLVLKKPMKGISESTAIANQFFILTGMIIIIIGGIVIYLFSRRLTRPIIEMSAAAESIAGLDFSQRVKVETTDEIGSLGKSINLIAEKLSSSIHALRGDVERRKLLVRNISHELKSPIGVIKGYAEGLKYGVADDREKADRYCATIAAECDRMDNMVRELLQLSMLESGTFQTNKSTFDVCVLVRNSVEKFAPFLVEKGITCKVLCEESVGIHADYELLERAVNNFITNAVNHVDEKRKLEVAVIKRDGRVRLSVYNSGGHLAPEDIKNVWDVFYKADKARSRQYGGHGLGLSIVRLIAELHDGAYGAENVEGGVAFYLEVPEN